MKILLAIAGVLMLSACAGALGEAKGRIQQSSDAFAQTTLAADCAIPYGAYTRLPLNQRLALELNCGGNWLETLKRLGVLDQPVVFNDNSPAFTAPGEVQ